MPAKQDRTVFLSESCPARDARTAVEPGGPRTYGAVMPTVRPAEAGEVPGISAALARAFLDEPLLSWMMPQRSRRTARRRLMFTLELQPYFLPQDGLVFAADDDGGTPIGACLALPPDRWRMPTTVDGRTAARWFGAYGRQLRRATRVQRTMERRHPDEPHYYVRWIGVVPSRQGQGLGHALLRPLLERCDSAGLPAYLEASSERSAALYAQLGFVHEGELPLPDDGPSVWPMRRPPGG